MEVVSGVAVLGGGSGEALEVIAGPAGAGAEGSGAAEVAVAAAEGGSLLSHRFFLLQPAHHCSLSSR